jgi:hypothetical protein
MRQGLGSKGAGMRKRFELTGAVSKEDPWETVQKDVRWIFNQALPFIQQGWLIAEEFTVWDDGDGKYRVTLVLDTEHGLKPLLSSLSRM